MVKIIFNHPTSQSDGQKGYANCLKHANCFRWKECSPFSNREEMAAYLYSWATSGEHLESREQHMEEWAPDPADVERVSGIMQLGAF